MKSNSQESVVIHTKTNPAWYVADLVRLRFVQESDRDHALHFPLAAAQEWCRVIGLIAKRKLVHELTKKTGV